jgi:type II secretory pathway component PulC
VLERAQVNAVVSQGLGRFLQKVDVEPSFAGGRFQGFRIVALRPAEFWQGVNLKPGDVVTQVNGLPIERETQAYDAFQSLRAAPELRVDYLRAGEPRVLLYPIR